MNTIKDLEFENFSWHELQEIPLEKIVDEEEFNLYPIESDYSSMVDEVEWLLKQMVQSAN